MKYPITPQYILNAPKPIEKLFLYLEAFILDDICKRLKVADNLTSTAIEQIRTLQRQGYKLEDIEKAIKQYLKLSDAQLDAILQKAVNDNQRYYSSVLNATDLLTAEFFNNAFQQQIDAIIAQTHNALVNITQSMGFSIVTNGQRTFLPIAQAYQKVLDHAAIKTWNGAQSYNQAMAEAVQELTDSGIRVVTWEKDGKVHSDHVDVAVRRAVRTGMVQMGATYSEQVRDSVPTEYIEITAHAGARDIDRKGRPWANHKAWQGRVYSTRDADKYPNIYEVCGWGEVDGLEGANCRHMHFPFWDGISERTYTDEQLENIDRPAFVWRGKRYTAYGATQQMRLFERQLRKVKRDLIGFKAAGATDKYELAAARYQKLNSEYNEFSKIANLRKTENGNIAEFGYKDGAEAVKSIKDIAAPASTRFVNHNDNLYVYASKVKPIDGYEDIVVHGDKVGLVVADANGVESNISIYDFADMIKESAKHGLYKGGNIRLLACEAGADGSLVAQGLANALNVDILAPTDVLWIMKDGTMQIGSDFGVNNGTWKLFKPKGGNAK